jgi:hypothetical protein
MQQTPFSVDNVEGDLLRCRQLRPGNDGSRIGTL